MKDFSDQRAKGVCFKVERHADLIAKVNEGPGLVFGGPLVRLGLEFLLGLDDDMATLDIWWPAALVGRFNSKETLNRALNFGDQLLDEAWSRLDRDCRSPMLCQFLEGSKVRAVQGSHGSHPIPFEIFERARIDVPDIARIN